MSTTLKIALPWPKVQVTPRNSGNYVLTMDGNNVTIKADEGLSLTEVAHAAVNLKSTNEDKTVVMEHNSFTYTIENNTTVRDILEQRDSHVQKVTRGREDGQEEIRR